MTITIQAVPPRVAYLLPLPDSDGLSVRQVRGATCIWCDAPLTAETAVDLGERRYDCPRFPRGCYRCAGRAAFVALHRHAPDCDECTHSGAGCATGAVLIRMIRDGRQ
jgi:hypothetical protein